MDILLYILKSTAILSLFFLVYKLFLQKDTFFESNRYFLLLGLVCAFVFSGMEFTQITYVEAAAVSDSVLFPVNELNYVSENIPEEGEVTQRAFNWSKHLLYLYLTGTTFMLARFVINGIGLAKILKHPKKRDYEGFYHIELPQKTAPFSFFNFIAYHVKSYQAKELEMIILHEKIHGKQYHSIDVILHQLMLVFFWFNPFAWWYNKHVLENLEYIVDREVAKRNNIHQQEYEFTLLKVSTSYPSPNLGNSFYQSLIKKRILMLHKSKSPQYAWVKSMLIIPLLSLFLWSFNVTEEVKTIPLWENNSTLILDTETLEDSKLITSELNSTKNNLEQHTSESLLIQQEKSYEITKSTTKRELEEIRKSLEKDLGKGRIKFYAKRNSDAEISHLDILAKFNEKENYIKRLSVKENFPIEILSQKNRMFVKMPGNVSTYISEKETVGNQHDEAKSMLGENPLTIINGQEVDESKESSYTFRKNSSPKVEKIEPKEAQALYGKKAKDGAIIIREVPEENKVTSNSTPSLQKDPLYYINGKRATKAEALQLKPDDIESMNVLKEESASMKYGEKAKNGVIEISLKKTLETFKLKEFKQNQQEYMYSINGVKADEKNVKLISPEKFISLKMYTEEDAATQLNIKTEGKKLMDFRLHKEGKEKHILPKEILQQDDYQDFLDNKKTLIIVNDKEVSLSFIKSLDKKLIRSVFIVGGQKAIEKYGEKAKNGVMVITTQP